MSRLTAFALVATIALTVACGNDTSGGPAATAVVTQLPTAIETSAPGETPPPAQVPNVAPATDITLPPGFAAYPIATGFLRATSVAPAPGGAIYVSERGGTVYRLVDADGDGVFEQSAAYAFGFEAITGLLVAPDGTLYVSSTGKVTRVLDADESDDIITGLPNGRHQNNGLAIGPDGKLYITNGSTCDDCLEADERSATILQSNLDGSELRVYAKGLRNPYDIVFDSNGQLWATDNGSDAPCATIDELNLIVERGDYGWPYGDDGCDPEIDGTPPVASLGLHTASTGIASYNGDQFPAEYNGNLFATVWGSLFADPDPYDRVLLRINVENDTGIVEEFASGFRHPIDVFADADGSLLALDYGSDDADERNGTLYRILYTLQ